jgi:hypothetical protein
MSASNFPQIAGQYLAVNGENLAVNIPANVASQQVVILRNPDNSTKYLNLPPGMWNIQANVLLDTNNGAVTNTDFFQLQIVAQQAGGPFIIINFGTTLYGATFPNALPSQYIQATGNISVNVETPVTLRVVTVNTDQILAIPANEVYLYAQYLGPTLTNGYFE